MRSVRAQGGLLVVGFVWVVELDGHAHMAEVSVRPDYGRQGVGNALLEADSADAAERGGPVMILTIFRDVPFNGPRYARVGFRELSRAEWGNGLASQGRAEEGPLVAPRIVVRRELP